MNSEEVEAAVRKNVSWSQLTNSVRQNVGNSAKEYDKCILHFSLKNSGILCVVYYIHYMQKRFLV